MISGNMFGEELVRDVSCINKTSFHTFPNRGMQQKTILFSVGLLGYYTWPLYAAGFFPYVNARWFWLAGNSYGYQLPVI